MKSIDRRGFLGLLLGVAASGTVISAVSTTQAEAQTPTVEPPAKPDAAAKPDVAEPTIESALEPTHGRDDRHHRRRKHKHRRRKHKSRGHKRGHRKHEKRRRKHKHRKHGHRHGK